MRIPQKNRWKATASSGDPGLAADDRYATAWTSAASKDPWIKIDLGAQASLGGLEVYWGRQTPTIYRFESSADGSAWSELCQTRHGEGGQDVFAFPPAVARFVRLVCEPFEREQPIEIVEVNLYDPARAAKVLEPGRLNALGHAPVTLPSGESITVDFGYVRAPLGALIAWGKTHGTVFSAHLSKDGKKFREVGRITTGDGDADSFWWRSTTARYFRLTVHEASAPEGAVVNELKLRILNKDRMPIGALERAAAAGRGELYPQSLLGRQVYWTALGEFDTAEQALFDEYADLEPERGGPQITPLVRLGRKLHGAPASKALCQSLLDGALPIPSVVWSFRDIEARATAIACDGQAVVEYSLRNRSGRKRNCALVIAVRPVQVNPYWQHGGHAPISAMAVEGVRALVNGRPFAAFSRKPDAATLAEFDHGDVVRLIEARARKSPPSLRSDSGLLSGAFEFAFALEPGERTRVVVACPMRAGVDSSRARSFGAPALLSRVPGARSSGSAASLLATARSAIPSKPRSRLSSSMRPALRSNRDRAITTAPGSATAPRRRSRCCGPGWSKRRRPTSFGTRGGSIQAASCLRSSMSTAPSMRDTVAISNMTRRASSSASRPRCIASRRTGPFSKPSSNRSCARAGSSMSSAPRRT